MGNTQGIMSEITSVSEDILGKLDAKGIMVVTFTSTFLVNELTEIFKLSGRNFMVFELDNNYSGYNIVKKEIMDELFGKVKPMEDFEFKLTSIINLIDFSGSTETEITEEEINKLSKVEKQKMINEILDKGPDNFSDIDKEILKKLSK